MAIGYWLPERSSVGSVIKGYGRLVSAFGVHIVTANLAHFVESFRKQRRDHAEAPLSRPTVNNASLRRFDIQSETFVARGDTPLFIAHYRNPREEGAMEGRGRADVDAKSEGALTIVDQSCQEHLTFCVYGLEGKYALQWAVNGESEGPEEMWITRLP
uniref:PPC domain-containing protein n=1 Tax=Steinernema glaseri TaxID=37863 RepID=A0A1I8AJB2_9BILA